MIKISWLHSFVTLFFLISLAMPTPSIAEQATSIATAPEPTRQMHEHLQAMEQRLRQRLLRIAESGSTNAPAATASKEEIQRLRRHLNSLENRLHAWNLDEGPALIEKVRVLRPWVDNLERASLAENRETAAASLAKLRHLLRVEGAPTHPNPLKNGINDDCAGAIPIGDGTYFGDTTGATADGESCIDESPDVWFAYTSPVTTEVIADTSGSSFNPVLSVHTGCPGTAANEVACDFGPEITFLAEAGVQYLIRLAGCCGSGGGTGSFTLNIGPAGTIAGTATDALTDEPVASAFLNAFTEEGFYIGFATTDAVGNYQFTGLPAGTYFVYIERHDNYLAEIYDDQPCTNVHGCDPLSGTPIEVASGATAGGIDFALRRGGTIAGTVTKTATGAPISDLAVKISDSEGNWVGYAHTSPAGTYSLSGLYPGTYYANTESGLYRDELYDDLPCPRGLCDPTTGEPIEVSFDATTEGVDFALDELGAISGTVSDSTTGFPILSAMVNIWDADGQYVKDAYVDSTGSYRTAGLVAGNYFVTTDVFGYLDELHDGIPCEPECDPTAGAPVAVSLESTTSGIDFALERLGVITGTVTHRPTGEPISAVIDIWDSAGDVAAYAFAGGTGNYLAEGLVPGNYTATVEESGYLGELFDDLPCPRRGACDPTTGTPIAVSLNTVTPDIDFALERLGMISGRVTHSTSGQPIEGATVDIYTEDGFPISSGYTDALGHYLAEGLETGNHFAVAHSYEYESEVYAEMPCLESCDPASGTPIVTQLNGITPGIDFTLNRLGSISGQVVHDGEPVYDANVAIYDSAGSYRRDAYTDTAGNYTVGGLFPGNHFAIGSHWQLDGELYDGLPCADGCDPTTGMPIAVSLNTTTPDIDFDLDYCTPTDTSLCLTGDRFRVEATWEDFQGVSGSGQAEGLTADAGTFWFFNPGNIEMVVKVLDVCIEPHNRFWVFAAGLTDVGVELTVTDELTGEMLSYNNDLGTPYEPVLDTLAFATCDAVLGRAVAEPPTVSAPPVADVPSPLLQGPATKGACVPGATSLCINDGRFLAEVMWQAPNGDGGAARVVPLTDESGYFWFGGADNVEVVVKVLNACDLAPFNNYWVFAAGLTNFEVTLKVTDTESGVFKEYSNPQGLTFQAITDTNAFDTCP